MQQLKYVLAVAVSVIALASTGAVFLRASL